MVRLFLFGGLAVDVGGSAVSLFGDCTQVGAPVWVGFNMLLFSLPLAVRITEPLLAAITDAPDVLRVDSTTTEKIAEEIGEEYRAAQTTV